MATISVEQIAERCEAELDRLKRSGRVSSVCIERAENILITHLSCPKSSIIRPRIRSGELVSYLVKGRGGAVYRVDPASWQCSCPARTGGARGVSILFFVGHCGELTGPPLPQRTMGAVVGAPLSRRSRAMRPPTVK